MTMKEAMKAIHMVRKYQDKPIPNDIVHALQNRVDENNTKHNLAVELRINDTSAFSAVIKLILAKGVKNFLILSGKECPELDEKLGYCGADLMLYAQTLGLNTWWVGGTFNRGKLSAEACGNKVIGVIAVGYGITQGIPHKTKYYNDVAHYDGEALAWFKEGADAALLAPTAFGRQDFSVEGKNGKVKIYCNNDSIFSGAELGLIKYHFELGAGADHFIWDEA